MRLQKRAAVLRAGSKRSAQAGGSDAPAVRPPREEPFKEPFPGGKPPGPQSGGDRDPADGTAPGENTGENPGAAQTSSSANGTSSTSTAISPVATSTETASSASVSSLQAPSQTSALSASSTPLPNPTSQPPLNNTPIIVGAVLGAVALLAVGAIILFILRKRRRVAKDSDSVGFQPDRMVVAGIRIPSFVSRTRGYAKTPVEEDYPGHVSGVGASHYDSYGPTRQVDWESPLTTTQPAFLIPAPYDHGSPAGTSSFVALPERQMELQELISQAQQKILRLGDSRRNSRVDDLSEADPEPEVLEARRLKARIRELERLKDSPWARGLTDVVPKELLKPI